MLKLIVRVEEDRGRTGVAELREGMKILSAGPVAATATGTISAQRGNPGCDPLRPWGHPAFGGYRLLHHVAARSELGGEYGTHLIVFEPESGQALDAESFGRLALLAYGGAPGRDGRLRRTQGGLRLADRMLLEIVERLRSGTEIALAVEPLRAPAWWQFWKRREDTQPLSESLLAPLAPPADEASVLEELLGNPALVRRRRARPARDEDRDNDYDRERDERRERSGSAGESGGGTFRGRGGESAGGGASGGWDAGPGRGPGVDQAGRIVAGAAVAAAGAALLGETARAVAHPRGDRIAADDAAAESDVTGGSGAAGDGGATAPTAY